MNVLKVIAITVVLCGGMFSVARADVHIGVVVPAPAIVIAPQEAPYYGYVEGGPYGYWSGGYWEGRDYPRGHYGSDYRHDNGRWQHRHFREDHEKMYRHDGRKD